MTRFSSGLSAPVGGTGTPQLPLQSGGVSAGQTAAGVPTPVASPDCTNCLTEVDEFLYCDGCGKVWKG